MAIPSKRFRSLVPDAVQHGNRRWWTENPMTYHRTGDLRPPLHSPDWYRAIDESFIQAARLYATERDPFDRLIPFTDLRGQAVLEIGCGMGLHTQLMARAGACVTSIDLCRPAVEATAARMAARRLDARVVWADAETLPFRSGSFGFVWSWGAIHHSARTARIVREIARVLAPGGECRVMVYNRESTLARFSYVFDHLLKGAFRHRTFDETLYQRSDGFSARFFVREHFEDLFRAFFADVDSEICGQEADAVPLPRRLRRLVLPLVPDGYLRRAQARRGHFIFLRARRPD